MDATRSRMLNINIGILGHVDSGKTSLVKALSTSLSTAALDKSSQSQQRGITLDLGFSAFTMPVPPHLQQDIGDEYDHVQYTLVDCPGHASLIKTIIGGAQIIDMIVLVIDINKGIQTQTAECIVIGEITTDKMIIVLNKIDLLPEEDREESIEKMKTKIKRVFSTTKFQDPVFVTTSAAVGGEKVAAVKKDLLEKESGKGQKKGHNKVANVVKTDGVDVLIDVIGRSISVPQRDYDGPFYFAIDHCFPIKGHGTVLTGTILSGSVQIGSTIELPLLQQQRKVKSMQMFRKPVKAARQGDRLGLCVANLDATLVERGIATTPNSVPLLSTVICMVKKVRFFKFPCKSNAKFHVTIGHSTIIANVVFFGKKELMKMMKKGDGVDQKVESLTKDDALTSRQTSLNASYHLNFPNVAFPWDDDFEYQEELEGAPEGNLIYGNEPLQWALIQFQQPVYCPLGSLIIGSRLETLEGGEAFGGGSQHCRLSFYGPIISSMKVSKTVSSGKTVGPNPLEALKIYRWKQKDCDVHRVIDVRNDRCYEAIGHNLYSKEAGNSIRAYRGMKLETENQELVGIVDKAFGSTNKFRIIFPHGAHGIRKGTKLYLRFKRYVYDAEKLMRQTGMELKTAEGDASSRSVVGNTNNEDDFSDYDSEGNVSENEDDTQSKDSNFKNMAVGDKSKKSIGISLPSTSSSSSGALTKDSPNITLPKTSSKQSKTPSRDVTDEMLPSKKNSILLNPENRKSNETSSNTPPSSSSPSNRSNDMKNIVPKNVTESKKPSSYTTLDLGTLGQKRPVAPKKSVSSSPSSSPVKQTQNNEESSAAQSTSLNWAAHLTNSIGQNESNKVISKSTVRNPSSGPVVKAGYQQHILESMQASNPFIKATNRQTTPKSTIPHKARPSYNSVETKGSPSSDGSKPFGVTSKGSRKKNNNDKSGNERCGTIESIKETAEGEFVAVVAGAFRMEENIRLFAGAQVYLNGVEIGEVIGPYAKMGKCKVMITTNLDTPLKSKVSISLPTSAHS